MADMGVVGMTMKNVHPFPNRPTHRTQEEIIRDCEKRYAELEAEKARRDEAERKRLEDPAVQFPCETCKWNTYDVCQQPLVKGFSNGYRIMRGFTDQYPPLCGLEKALWEKKGMIQSIWQKYQAIDNDDLLAYFMLAILGGGLAFTLLLVFKLFSSSFAS